MESHFAYRYNHFILSLIEKNNVIAMQKTSENKNCDLFKGKYRYYIRIQRLAIIKVSSDAELPNLKKKLLSLEYQLV